MGRIPNFGEICGYMTLPFLTLPLRTLVWKNLSEPWRCTIVGKEVRFRKPYKESFLLNPFENGNHDGTFRF